MNFMLLLRDFHRHRYLMFLHQVQDENVPSFTCVSLLTPEAPCTTKPGWLCNKAVTYNTDVGNIVMWCLQSTHFVSHYSLAWQQTRMNFDTSGTYMEGTTYCSFLSLFLLSIFSEDLFHFFVCVCVCVCVPKIPLRGPTQWDLWARRGIGFYPQIYRTWRFGRALLGLHFLLHFLIFY
jgi:hypothetical protein